MHDDDRKKWRDSGIWHESPFANVEKSLPVNVVSARDTSERALKTVSNPIKTYGGKEGDVVTRYRGVIMDQRYGVISLALPAKNLVKKRLCAIAFENYEVRVKTWMDVLDNLLGYCVNEREEDVEILETAGLMKWIIKEDRSVSLLESIRTGKCRVELRSMKDFCKSAQWLFLVLGISLNNVGLCVDLFSDEQWRAFQRRQEKQRFSKVKMVQAAPAPQVKSHGTAAVLKNNPIPKKKKRKTATKYHNTDPDVVKYYVIDGVVVRENSLSSSLSDKEISRSSSECGEDWKGYGYIARDNGRYGQIDGADYAD